MTFTAPPADASAIDTAVLNQLSADATLQGVCPDGVYWDISPAGAEAFVVVTLFDHEDTIGLASQDLYEHTTYLVKTVIQGTDAARSRQAAARVHELLHGAALDLTAASYTLMDLRRLVRIRYTEIDPVDTAIRWQHRGGRYELMASRLYDYETLTTRRTHGTTARQ